MQATLIVLLVASIIGAAQSQSWTGTYIADSSCNTVSCCCLSGKVVSTVSSTNIYGITSSVTGNCGGSTTFSGTAYTNGYTGWMVVGGNNDTLTLSSDSSTITVTNSVNPACSGKGVRSGTIKQHANILLLLAVSVIGMVVSASNI